MRYFAKGRKKIIQYIKVKQINPINRLASRIGYAEPKVDEYKTESTEIITY